MRDAYDRIRAAGVRLVVVGNGRPEHAAAFREDEQIPFELWVDPEMQAYRAAGLRRGVASAASLRSPGHLWRALRGGFRQGKTQGDPWQQGGAFVITPAGETRYQQISREAGDHPPLAELLAAVEAVGDASERGKNADEK